jgi:hypothetical protein
MALESAQMLSTAINLRGGRGPYRTTHANHPCSIWTRTSTANYLWLLQHFQALCSEYTRRFGKIHACTRFMKGFEEGLWLIPDGELTPWPNCTPLKEEQDTHLAYKLTLEQKWKHDVRPPTWRQGKPEVRHH